MAPRDCFIPMCWQSCTDCSLRRLVQSDEKDSRMVVYLVSMALNLVSIDCCAD
jgi:hypothetical protein